MKFEQISGDVLSRNKNWNVVGFGCQSKKEFWPIAWLNPVKAVMNFGNILDRHTKRRGRTDIIHGKSGRLRKCTQI